MISTFDFGLVTPMKIVLTGGGTGGHIYPAISIGQALKKAVPDVELLYVGSSHGPEGDIARKAGLEFVAIPSSSLSKALSARNIAAFSKLLLGFFRARRILGKFKPDVVIGTGGYVSAAILLAQWSRRGKIVIHEQNARPGRTNTALAKLARKVCVTFESSTAFLPKGRVEVTGLPIRSEFTSHRAKSEARQVLGLDPDVFTIVAIGGSQGARKVNEIVAAAWPLVSDGKTQILHQVGQRNIEEMRALIGTTQDNQRYHVEAYVDMPVALGSADLVISRSGASSIAEITTAGLPSILFPYPHAYADHQTGNAMFLVDNHAALLCGDSSTTPEMLAGMIIEMRSAPEKLAAMGAASAGLGKPDAADRVAQIAIAVAKG